MSFQSGHSSKVLFVIYTVNMYAKQYLLSDLLFI